MNLLRRRIEREDPKNKYFELFEEYKKQKD